MSEVPSKELRDEWRRLAKDTMMISAVGEYTPEEFTELLDAVDYLEQRNADLERQLAEAQKQLTNPDFSRILKGQ